MCTPGNDWVKLKLSYKVTMAVIVVMSKVYSVLNYV